MSGSSASANACVVPSLNVMMRDLLSANKEIVLSNVSRMRISFFI
jgi:hypothetical protein